MAKPDAKVTPLTPTAAEVVGGQPPFVHPAVAGSPEALAYQVGVQARLQQRKQQPPLVKYTEGRPGPGPAMPPLEAPHYEGMTIERQAGMFGPRPEERAVQGGGGSIIEGTPRGSFGAPAAGGPALQMTDTLPPEAMEDPSFIPGQGSLMAVNQPRLAAKYGVLRGGQRISPAALAGGSSGRRSVQDTLRDLQAAAGAASPPPPGGLPRSDQEAEAQVTRSAAGSSQNVGRSPARGQEGESSEEDPERARKIQEAIQLLDDFDYDTLRQQMNKDMLNTPDQRDVIEERLAPLSLEELILRDKVRQRVPIVPKTFEVTFESMTGMDDLALKRLLMQESKSVEVVERYLLDKFALMTLTAGVVAINGNPVPFNCYDKDGEFNDDQFWLKFGWMLKRGIHVLASMGYNHTWFEMRVRKLLVVERVKNG